MLLHLLVCIFFALHGDTIRQASFKITKVLRSFNKTSGSVLFLGFQYFELRNIYKRIPNHIRIPIFGSEFVHR